MSIVDATKKNPTIPLHFCYNYCEKEALRGKPAKDTENLRENLL